MKIFSLEATNYRKLAAFHLILDGRNLKVAGTTGQGKTTAVSLLWEILETVGDPINNAGKEPGAKALVRVVFGTPERRYIAERKYTAGGTDISIRSEDGKSKVSAREFRTWVSSLAVNPHRIMDLGPQERTATLLRAARVPEGVDLDAIDRQRADAHERREDARKDVARLKASQGIRPREVVAVDVQASRAQLVELERDKAQGEAELQSAGRELEGIERDLAEAIMRVRMLEARKAETTARRDEIRVWMDENVKPEELARLQDEVARADELNREATAWTEWQRKNQELQDAEARFTAAEQEVRACEASKREALEAIVWPLPGLEVRDGEIWYKGVPLVQAGESEKLLVCGSLAAHEIAQSPLRVVRLDGIESMSSEDFAQLEALFEEHDIQVLASRVTRGDLEEGELLIHEGKVQEVEP